MRERTGRSPGSRRSDSPFPAPRRQWVMHRVVLVRLSARLHGPTSTPKPLTVAGPRRSLTGFLKWPVQFICTGHITTSRPYGASWSGNKPLSPRKPTAFYVGGRDQADQQRDLRGSLRARYGFGRDDLRWTTAGKLFLVVFVYCCFLFLVFADGAPRQGNLCARNDPPWTR